MVAIGFEFPAPAYCAECGNPFSWTESRLRAAHEYVQELDELSPEEQARLNQSIDQITRDTPQTEVAATRVKKILLKLGKAGGEALHKFLVDVASETAKKILTGG